MASDCTRRQPRGGTGSQVGGGSPEPPVGPAQQDYDPIPDTLRPSAQDNTPSYGRANPAALLQHNYLQPGGWPHGQPPPHHHSPRPVMRHQAKALRSVALWADGNGAQFCCRSARCTMSRCCAPGVWHRHHDAGKHTQAFSERPDGDSARALRWWARAEGHAGASDA